MIEREQDNHSRRVREQAPNLMTPVSQTEARESQPSSRGKGFKYRFLLRFTFYVSSMTALTYFEKAKTKSAHSFHLCHAFLGKEK